MVVLRPASNSDHGFEKERKRLYNTYSHDLEMAQGHPNRDRSHRVGGALPKEVYMMYHPKQRRERWRAVTICSTIEQMNAADAQKCSDANLIA